MNGVKQGSDSGSSSLHIQHFKDCTSLEKILQILIIIQSKNWLAIKQINKQEMEKKIKI